MASRSIDPVVARRRAAALAGHTGDDAGARALLDDTDGGVRGAALGALQRMAALTLDELVAGLADPDPTVRRRGVRGGQHLRWRRGDPC